MSKEFLIHLGNHPHEKQIYSSNPTSNVLVPRGNTVLVLQQIPRSDRGSIKSNIFLHILPFLIKIWKQQKTFSMIQ